jgi:hypothetical protein
MEQIQLYSKIQLLPKELKSEVSDFIEFLLNKKGKQIGVGSTKQAVFGSAKGTIKMSSDFDNTLEDFKEYM